MRLKLLFVILTAFPVITCLACTSSPPKPVKITLPRNVEIRADHGTEITFLSEASDMKAVSQPAIQFQHGREFIFFGKHYLRFKLVGVGDDTFQENISFVANGHTSTVRVQMNPPTDSDCTNAPVVTEMN